MAWSAQESWRLAGADLAPNRGVEIILLCLLFSVGRNAHTRSWHDRNLLIVCNMMTLKVTYMISSSQLDVVTDKED